MTIYELKKRNTEHGGKFFSRDAMKTWRDTLKGLSVSRDVDPLQVIVTRKKTGTAWRFNVNTGRMVAPHRA